VKPVRDQLIQEFGNVDLDKTLPTLNHWHDRGGLVGRGVLLDYRAYAQAKGIKYDSFSDHTITVQDLDEIAKMQGTELRQGDILIVRSGFTEDLGAGNAEEQEKWMGTHKTVGVKGCVESAKWFWNHHFAAVAGDAIAFEQTPPRIEEDGNREGKIDELGKYSFILAISFRPHLVCLVSTTDTFHQFYISISSRSSASPSASCGI
jgi:hypothetical protein